MKYFKCTVCGYVHEGPEPPDKCPVCNAPKEKFIELPEDEGEKAYEAYVEKMGDKMKTILAKLEKDASEEKEAEEKKGDDTALVGDKKKPEKEPSRLKAFMFSQMAKNHAHPVSVHIPNGVLPAAVLFLVLSMFFEIAGMPEAAFYNLVFVVIAMPFVIFSGYVDWQERYGGARTRVIVTKIICGIAVLFIGIALIVWHNIDMGVTNPGSSDRWTYFLVHMLMLSFAGYAGYLGGSLVFKD
jgi:rubredoxin/uncharacterized membrane protein